MECVPVGVGAWESVCEGEAEREPETKKWGSHVRVCVCVCETRDSMIFQVRANQLVTKYDRLESVFHHGH